MAGFQIFSLIFCIVFAGDLAAQTDIMPLRQKALINLLKHDCGSCHGLTMRGGLGPPLTPAVLQDKPATFLENIILHGVPKSAMPPWQDHLSQQEVRWLVDLLKNGLTP